MKPSDPAYFMLEEGLADESKRSKKTVHKDGCFICEDPEFALMGLPLCFGCEKCGSHIAADAGPDCEACGFDHSAPRVSP